MHSDVRQCTAIILSLHYMFLKKRANMILESTKSRQKYWRHGLATLFNTHCTRVYCEGNNYFVVCVSFVGILGGIKISTELI